MNFFHKKARNGFNVKKGGSVYINDDNSHQINNKHSLPKIIKNDPSTEFSATQFFANGEQSSYSSLPNLNSQFSNVKFNNRIGGSIPQKKINKNIVHPVVNINKSIVGGSIDEINYNKIIKKSTKPKRAIWTEK